MVFHGSSLILGVLADGYPSLVTAPQTGIFALGTMSHAYLEFALRPDADPREVVQRVASLREPRSTIGGVNLVAGFRPELWASVAPDAVPAGLTGFNEPIVGAGGYTLPATQRDIVVWLTGAAYDVVFDVSRGVVVGARVARDPGGRDGRLAVPPGPRPDGLRGRHREPDAGGGDRRRRSSRPARPARAAACCCSSSGSTTRPRGRRCRSTSRNRSSAARKLDQRRARPEARDVARRPHGPGHVRQDLPTQHRVRDADPPRHDLRGLQPGPRAAGRDAPQHDRRRRRAARPADRLHAALTGAYYFVPSIEALAAFASEDPG